MGFGFTGTYGDGGRTAEYTADYSGLGGGGGAGDGSGGLNAQANAFSTFDPTVLMNILLKNKRDMLAYGQERKDWEYGRAKREAQAAQTRASQTMGRPNIDPLAAAGQRAQLAGLRAHSGPAPTKMTYVGNSPGFQELDPMAMSAAQRQAFLPQGAQYSGPSLIDAENQTMANSTSGMNWAMGIPQYNRQRLVSASLGKG